MLFADIIVDISHEKLDRPFQYIIPERLIEKVNVGCQVEVPFGKGNRIISGYVIDIKDTPEYELSKLKEIKEIKLGSLRIESQLIVLAWYIKEHYGSTMNKALKTVIPIKKKVKNVENKFIRLKISKDEARELIVSYNSKKNTVKRAVLLEELISTEGMDYELARTKLGVSDSIIKALENARIIEIEKNIAYRNPVAAANISNNRKQLNQEQMNVVNEISSSLDEGKTHVIFGVTGSGKTEVYMEIIDKVLENGKEAIVLIPEIALTYQTIKRFYERFGNVVSIINSKLSAGEKYDQFERAKNGEVKIMIGPRSALFTPFKNLGIIVIDEEHEGAYKSETVPKYHAREVAIERARLCGATVVLGSATPSIDSFYKTQNKEYELHCIKNRANDSKLANVTVIDMRDELESGNKDIFSGELTKKMSERLERKEQIMLFLNRRGYSTFVSCRKCGKPMKCPHCDVSLTLHKSRYGDKLNCHYCGYSIESPKVCMQCGSKFIGGFGIGTEQLEQRVNEIFPNAKTLRMDVDTTRGKNDYERILSTFASGEADILIGTQMIVKGHDFPDVTLVGIVAADLSMFSGDFMSGEKTFQLLTQAAGRAGRGKRQGEVVIQTYNPEESSIVFASKQDYEGFYENEMVYRKLMTYPPVYDMIAVLIMGDNDEFTWAVTKDIAERIEKTNIPDLKMIGPSRATISKINDIYRNIIYLKHQDEKILIKVKNAICKYVESNDKYKKITIQFDHNPMSGY